MAITSLCLVAGAQAAVTSSSISSPSDPFYGLDQGQSITVSGTSNGTSGDKVDIECYVDNGSTGSPSYAALATTSVNSDGSFSTPVALSKFDSSTYNPKNPCRLRAVPSGTSPTTGLSSYSGPRVLIGYLSKNTTPGGQLEDYYAYAPQLTASADYNSYAGCGLADSYLLDSSVFGQIDSIGFYCNDWANNPTESDSSRTAVLVDGHPAYAPAEEDAINSSAVGFEPLVINSVNQNSSNGNFTIVETDPLVRCVGDPYPATSTNCAGFMASGVQVKRTITQTDTGHIVYVDDAYSSTNGSSHSVNLLTENDQYFRAPRGSQDVQYEFPGQTSFSAYASGQTVSVPSTAPASILIEDGGTADGSTSGARGAITYGQAPSGSFKFTANSCCSNFDAPNTVSVPSSGAATIRYAYSTEFTLAAVQHDALVAQDAFLTPALKITSPRNHSKVKAKTRRITVKGTASAGSGVKSVTVNGKAATVSGGKFSTTVRLHTGRNTIKVELTSSAGNTVRKSVTVTRVKAAKAKKKKKPAPTFTG